MLAGRFDNRSQEDHHRVQLGDSVFDLVLHPQTARRSPKELGPRIRTLYPKFRGGPAAPSGEMPAPGGEPAPGGGVPTQPHNSGAVRIHRALPNPEAAGDAGEWVELRSAVAEAVALDGWRLVDEQGRSYPLEGTLAPVVVRRFVTRAGDAGGGLQLANSGGWILLYEGEQRRAAVRYGRAGPGEIKSFE